MVGTIKLFEILKTRFNDEEARFVVEEIEKIEATVEAKVEKAFDQKKDTLATRGDISNLREDMANLRGELKADIASSKAEMIKWMFIFWIGQLASFIAIAKFFFHQ